MLEDQAIPVELQLDVEGSRHMPRRAGMLDVDTMDELRIAVSCLLECQSSPISQAKSVETINGQANQNES